MHTYTHIRNVCILFHFLKKCYYDIICLKDLKLHVNIVCFALNWSFQARIRRFCNVYKYVSRSCLGKWATSGRKLRKKIEQVIVMCANFCWEMHGQMDERSKGRQKFVNCLDTIREQGQFLTSIVLIERHICMYVHILMSKTSIFPIWDLAFQIALFGFLNWNWYYTTK